MTKKSQTLKMTTVVTLEDNTDQNNLKLNHDLIYSYISTEIFLKIIRTSKNIKDC